MGGQFSKNVPPKKPAGRLGSTTTGGKGPKAGGDLPSGSLSLLSHAAGLEGKLVGAL